MESISIQPLIQWNCKVLSTYTPVNKHILRETAAWHFVNVYDSGWLSVYPIDFFCGLCCRGIYNLFSASRSHFSTRYIHDKGGDPQQGGKKLCQFARHEDGPSNRLGTWAWQLAAGLKQRFSWFSLKKIDFWVHEIKFFFCAFWIVWMGSFQHILKKFRKRCCRSRPNNWFISQRFDPSSNPRIKTTLAHLWPLLRPLSLQYAEVSMLNKERATKEATKTKADGSKIYIIIYVVGAH